ncbi:MAG: hypothetical protein ISQ32_04880 [Rickettsiales bacterium]|nr:hypothetical protein [Rickettsiales bacterium]
MKNLLAIIFCFITSINLSFATEYDLFTLQGDTLIYDTGDVDIKEDDYNNLKEILLENDDIKTIQLNSYGGDLFAANAMGDLIVDFELNTHAVGICESACINIFIAGEKRTLERGSKLGFHRAYMEVDLVREDYVLFKDEMGWEDEFDLAVYMYDIGMDDAFTELKLLLERGVDADFAIRTLSTESDGMWYPRRKELIEANVITE